MINNKTLAFSTLCVVMLSACGGGGGSSNTTTTNSTNTSSTNTSPTWNQGVFASANNFKSRCANPRTGVDMNGQAYSDIAGSTLHEKHWLRSWSNDTYLWYNEIVDSNPALIENPVNYFNTLKTTAVTASGNPQDRYHYAQNTEEYLQLTSGGASLSYGARFQILKRTSPREARIAYVEPNSPAADAGLARGAEIIMIDGVDFVNGSDTDTLNKGLFPKVNNESHTFVVRDLGQTNTRTVTLRAEVVTTEPVKATRIINTPSGKVGYLALNTFGIRSAEKALIDAFTYLENESPDDLVLDLRYNGGGFIAISAQLGYMIAGDALSSNKVYEKTIFNNKYPTTNPVTGRPLSPVPFINTTIGFSTSSTGQALPKLNLNRVYVLSSSRTCSASESLINGLRGIDVEVVLIGGSTCGKPFGFYPTDNCGVTYSTIQFRGENAKGFGDYADGFSPNNATGVVGQRIQGCQVQEDVLNPLGDEQEVMLKAALQYRESSTCPPIPAGRALVGSDDLTNDPYYREQALREQIRMDHMRLQWQ